MKVQLLCVALLILAGSPVLAQEQKPPAEFDVELIIFRHLTPDNSEPPVVKDDGDPQSGIERRRFTPLTAEQLRLGPVSTKLLGSRDWSPILHYGWRQPVLGRDDAPAVSIAGNRRGGYASGSVRLTVERYLRLELELQMDPGTGTVYTMNQRRRMRSGELHYFDHPQFGVIVLVSRAEQ